VQSSSSWWCIIAKMSNETSTPEEGTNGPCSDEDNPADGVCGGGEVTGVMLMQAEFTSTQSSSVKVGVGR
jgi:hypothetical protein